MTMQKKEDQGAVALVQDLAKASSVSASRWFGAGRRVSVRKILRLLCGYFEHERPVQFEGCVAEPLQTITAILPGSKLELLTSAYCVTGCTE